ncbi:bacillibactin ABC transporter integral membrane protein [Natranaerovirga hydrolytica]|uniref:Bacillibactin ABC transporter integral membrane protein n=1 Tax=Natranaerovirga hydrolytica TaxID=680378 RepID=A0A4R1MMJ1_9FIRM|nr:iron ABC transporter permease [Natranaerovirga hydrolytica]TCK93330.1 bacillibactin ABC transporter integral membrane protein [Natranaerovirga hydrolytica]
MQKKSILPMVILIISPILMILSVMLSIVYGAKSIDTETIVHAFTNFDAGNVNHQIIVYSRIPRAIGALLVGGFLGISGAMMQGMTRNYLASPSIMGVSDGSAFVITMAMIFYPGLGSMEMIVVSFVGSLIGLVIVFGIASALPNGFSPVKLALIGTIIGAFLSSLSAALANYFQVSQDISFWYNARLHQLTPTLINIAIPAAIIGLTGAFALSKSVTILSLGEDIAKGLGQNTKVIKALGMIVVAVLTGTSVALVGKIGFVGLVIPHITRFIVGVDYKWIIPCSGVIGAVFLVLCDVISRFMNYPFETPIGVITSLVGVPFFLYLIRKKGGEKHV